MAELEIDQSHLPRVQKVCQCFAVLEDGVLAHSLQEQEIEQHYSSNVQKNQLVQKDLRVAKRLQDEEERGGVLTQTTRQLEEQDFEYARLIQDEIQRCADEAKRREREDEEVAKRIQEEEEMGARRRKLEGRCHGNITGLSLSEGAELWQRGAELWQRGAGLELGSLQQVLLDQELAWRLQEEENIHGNLRKGSSSRLRPPIPDPEGDFRVAQVAQDEEIARFMQRQEMKSKWRSCDLKGQGSQHERGESSDVRERRASQDQKLQVQMEELPSPSEERTEPPHPPSPVRQWQPIRNIAEELDPTFKARQKDTSQSKLSRTDHCQAPPTPHRGFHDYTDEPFFIPPTKRQSDRPARGKAKEKKDGCKQQ